MMFAFDVVLRRFYSMKCHEMCEFRVNFFMLVHPCIKSELLHLNLYRHH